MFNPAFWSSLSGPAVISLVGALFIWALATERLVLGKQYRAERARADKYDDANRVLTDELIRVSTTQQATTNVLESLRDAIGNREAQ